MSFNTSHHARFVVLFAVLIVGALNTPTSHATILAPGGATALSGTTSAAQPALGGPVIVDDLIPYQIFGGGVGNPLLYEGVLQARIVRSNVAGDLIFYYQLRDPTNGLNGVMGTLVAGHDVGQWADALSGLLRLSAPQAEAMGRAAAAHATTFSWDHTTDALLASYRRAIREDTAERRGVGA